MTEPVHISKILPEAMSLIMKRFNYTGQAGVDSATSRSGSMPVLPGKTWRSKNETCCDLPIQE